MPSRQKNDEVYRLRSFAKINLGLEILGKRRDGFHELKTIFQTIRLHDTLTLTPTAGRRLHIEGNDPSVDWQGDNTIRLAFDTFGAAFNLRPGFHIRVEKKIPPGSGLGGGSSNAAVILMFLARYYRRELSLNRLIRLGETIGADVPFFFIGGTALGRGKGEKLFEIRDLGERTIGLYIPDIRVSTEKIFSRFSLTSDRFPSKIDSFLKNKKLAVLENHLESVTFNLFPELRMIKEKIEMNFNCPVWMSGSGSALYTIAPRKDLSRLQTVFPGLLVTRLLNRKNYHRKWIGVSPSGKASVFGADIRGFKSSHPSFFKD